MSLAIGRMNNNINKKPILAIETSAENCGASLFFDGKKYSDFNVNVKNVHSEKLLGLIDKALSVFKLKSGDLSAVAVSMGPGSFTGLRIGLAAAKGFALGAGLPIIPVPTFYAAADFISKFLPNNVEFVLLRKVNVKELYGEIYRSTNLGFDIVNEMEILNKEDIADFVGKRLTYSDSQTGANFQPFPTLSASIIAAYAISIIEENLTFDFDYLEPNYFKKFIPRVNK